MYINSSCIVLKHHSESFNTWSAIIRINTAWGWILDYEMWPCSVICVYFTCIYRVYIHKIRVSYFQYPTFTYRKHPTCSL